MEKRVRFHIKEYAQEQGLRLGELARKLRMPLSNLSALASGRRSVSLLLLSRIAVVLNCEVSELFDNEGVADVYPAERLNARIQQLERENHLGNDKGWTHRLSFHLQSHYQSVREGDAPYGSGIKQRKTVRRFQPRPWTQSMRRSK